MWFQNKLDRLAPNLANARSAMSQKVKGWHPIKTVWAWGQRMMRRVSRSAVTVQLKANELGSHLPRIPLSFRTAAEADAVSIVMSKSFDAQSREGIELKPEDQPEVLKAVDGLEIHTREDDSPGAVKGAKRYVLKGVKKKALKQRATRMEKANNLFIRANNRLTKAEARQRPEREITTLLADVSIAGEEKEEAASEYDSLKLVANRLKFKELAERRQNSHTVRVLESVKTIVNAIDAKAFDEAITDIRTSMTDAWKRQAELEREVDDVANKLKAWVYKDVATYLDTDPRFATLVDAKSKHQLISGTEKLQFATEGHKGRWPGLDFYVVAAKDKHRSFSKPNSQVVKALEMMKEDMDIMMPAMLAQMEAIRQDDRDNPGEGSFDANRMSDYYNLKAWMRTHMEVTQMLADPSEEGISNMMGSYGELLGFEFGRTSEQAEMHRSDVARKYGFSPDQSLLCVSEQMAEAGIQAPAPAPAPVLGGGLTPEIDETTATNPWGEVSKPVPSDKREKSPVESDLMDFEWDVKTEDPPRPMYEPAASPGPQVLQPQPATSTKSGEEAQHLKESGGSLEDMSFAQLHKLTMEPKKKDQ